MTYASTHRTDLVEAMAVLRGELEIARFVIADTEPEPPAAVLAEEQQLADQLMVLQEIYLQILPEVPVARDPLDGSLITRTIDVEGLDGPWWRHAAPIRPQEPLDDRIYAFTGALALDDDVENTEYLVKPGPAVPFVIPSILDVDGMVAVVSTVGVGRHRGYVVTYFAEQPVEGLERANAWGADHYLVAAGPDDVGWGEEPEYEGDYDFDLERWIEQGKLQWIDPDDLEMELRTGTDGCPFIGLDGVREIQRIQDGEVWYPSLIDD